MTQQEILTAAADAKSLPELLSDEVKAAYREEADPVERAMLAGELRVIARKGKFLKEFDKAFRAFEKSVNEAEWAALEQERAEKRSAREAANKIEFSILENPYPFLRSYTYTICDDGVFLGGERICTQPVLVFGKYRNIENGEDAFCFAYHDGFQWRQRIEKRSVLFSTAQIIHLAAYGLSVHSANAQQFIRFLDTFENENSVALEPKMSVSRLGWFDGNRFAPYEPAFTFAGRENQDLYDAVAAAGSAEKWIAYMKELRKNIPLRLTMAASFASPLLKKVDALPFVFHIWGGSGVGKTVALMVAMSIWGDPSFGKLLRTLNATVNYIVNTATFFCSVPVAYDELQITGAWYSNIEALVMMLTEGLNRGRMKYDESKQALPWNCCFLFSGEGPVVKPGSGGGVFNRVIEVECRGPVIPDGNQTASFVRENHGHAGKVYIDHIKSQDIPALFREQQTEIIEKVNTTGKQASSMALMMIADRLAGECLFHDEQPLTVEIVRRYLKTEQDVDVSERAYSYICGVIAANVSKFMSNSPDTPGRPASSEIWGRIDSGACTFNKVKLEDRLREGGFDFDAVKKKWAEKGYLEKSNQGKYIHNASYGGVKAYSVRLIVDDEAYRTQDDELPL